MRESPTVSVIVPCFNHGAFLPEAIESVSAQSFSDFEILLVDDGSNDASTLELLSRASWPKTQKLRIEHAGVTAARNFGIERASGRFLTFFDSDDRMHPEFLERTVSTLEGDASLSFVSCWVRLFGEESWDWQPRSCDFPQLLHECTVATAALVRRDAVHEVGGFDPSFELGHEDWELWLSLVERGYRGTILPEILFFYRRSGQSRSTVADRGATYVELYRDRLTKHEDAYRAHLFDVLWLKNAEAEVHHATWSKARRAIQTLEAEARELRREVEVALTPSRRS
jgi:glycosyltransferase involved in cell wall biosynthesis